MVTWDSSDPMFVGGVPSGSTAVNRWDGGIDDVAIFQGPMNDAQVKALYDSQLDAL